MFEKLSIVIPVFNEELTIKQILSKVIEVNLLNDLIFKRISPYLKLPW